MFCGKCINGTESDVVGVSGLAVSQRGQVVVPRETATGARELLADLRRRMAIKIVPRRGHEPGAGDAREAEGTGER